MYADVTYADTYFSGTTNFDLWNAIDVAKQPLLLENASRYIDVGFNYSGSQTDEVKAFPRSECYNKCNSFTYADDVVPVIVQNATCEIALQMNNDEELSTVNLNTFDGNVVKEKVSSLEVEYRDAPSEGNSPDPYGYTWLQCIIKTKGGVGSYRVRKG